MSTEHVEATAVGACELVRLSPVDESLIIWHVLVFGCLVNVSTPKLPPSPTMFWHRYLPSGALARMLRLKHATQAAMQPDQTHYTPRCDGVQGFVTDGREVELESAFVMPLRPNMAHQTQMMMQMMMGSPLHASGLLSVSAGFLRDHIKTQLCFRATSTI